MHLALSIDEVLQTVFQFSMEDGLATLVSVARTCKAWKEPALDYIWSRLLSVIPLLRLIPSLELDNGIYTPRRPIQIDEMKLFLAYARRVKHITHKERVRVDPEVLSLLSDASMFPSTLGVLQHLRSVQISASNYTALQKSFGLSPQLERLDCDLGFSSRTALSSDAVCDYFDHATAMSTQLQTVSVRGHGSLRLNKAISCLTHLSTLSLRMGKSLLPETLKTVLAFPCLSELELHAGHVDIDGLSETGNSTTFTVLQKLNVRAHTPVIAFLLERLQPGTIHTVQLDLEDDSLTSKSWQNVTDLLTCKGETSIYSLTIEHHVEEPDGNDSSNSDGTGQRSTGERVSASDDTPLSYLRKLGKLRRLVLDMVSPPTIHDKDVKCLGSWWPDITHLEIGHTSADTRSMTPPVALSSLITFAQFLPHLRQLSLPLLVESIPEPSSITEPKHGPALERLYVSCISPHDAGKLAQFLNRIFPCLSEIDGPALSDGDWEKTQRELDTLRAVPGRYCLPL